MRPLPQPARRNCFMGQIMTVAKTSILISSSRYLDELRRLHNFAEGKADSDARHEPIAIELAKLISQQKSRAA